MEVGLGMGDAAEWTPRIKGCARVTCIWSNKQFTLVKLGFKGLADQWLGSVAASASSCSKNSPDAATYCAWAVSIMMIMMVMVMMMIVVMMITHNDEAQLLCQEHPRYCHILCLSIMVNMVVMMIVVMMVIMVIVMVMVMIMVMVPRTPQMLTHIVPEMILVIMVVMVIMMSMVMMITMRHSHGAKNTPDTATYCA